MIQSEDPNTSENRNPAMHATPLPDELAACHALLVEQARTITQLHQRVQEQELTINELMQRAFRHRSERYVEDPN